MAAWTKLPFSLFVCSPVNSWLQPLDGKTIQRQAEPVDIRAFLRIKTLQGTAADVLQERLGRMDEQ